MRTSRKIKDTGHLNQAFIGRIRDQMPGPFRTSQLHIGRNPTEFSLARYRAIPPGGNRHDLANAVGGKLLSTESWMNHHSDSGDVMGRLVWEKPSVTIRTEFFKSEKGRYLHPGEHRPITHLDAALIQGFPQHFRWFGSKSQIARQIGNAVPVELATAIAKVIRQALRGGAGLTPSTPPGWQTLVIVQPPSTTSTLRRRSRPALLHDCRHHCHYFPCDALSSTLSHAEGATRRAQPEKVAASV
ncbi:DNA cytosine methyltransferase [Streptomyces platensis]|uniref:DNA cytosine methyltransferase n=1 Tax=Streptomyces platensis TaxID=58346 RepID=UPI002ED4A09A|nr:DNA cytosine methyltransferase [Streptomyces platensis]